MNAVTMTNNINFILSDEVRPYVLQFNTFLNKSAEAVLEMGRVVYEARKTLKKKAQFNEFCAAIRLKTDGSAISKLKTIGKRYVFLSQFKDSLPDAWTTLYHLARMKDNEFEIGVQQSLIHKTMTANELRILDPNLFKTRKHTIESEVVVNKDIKISVGDLLAEEVRNELLEKLQNLCLEYGVEVVELGE